MLRTIFTSLFLIALPAAASAAQVRVDYDRHRDFGKYQTFAVEIGPLVRADGEPDAENTLAVDRLREAVTREFTARGLEPTDGAADLVVRVSSPTTCAPRSSAPAGIAMGGPDGEDTGVGDIGAHMQARTTGTSGPAATSKARSPSTSSNARAARWCIAPR